MSRSMVRVSNMVTGWVLHRPSQEMILFATGRNRKRYDISRALDSVETLHLARSIMRVNCRTHELGEVASFDLHSVRITFLCIFLEST